MRLNGAILRNVSESFAPQCRRFPKLPEGAETANDETRVKQHFAEAEETGVSVCTSAPRLGLSTPSPALYPLLAEQQPMRRSSSHIDHARAHTQTRTHVHGKVLPPSPSSPAATLRERGKISLNKEASGDRQTAPAPPSKEGETRVVVWL